MHAALHSQGYKVVSLLSFDDCVRSESWSSYKENIFISLKNVTCNILWSISWKYCVLVSKDRGRYSIALQYSAEEFLNIFKDLFQCQSGFCHLMSTDT